MPKPPLQITFLPQGKRRSELLNKVLACYPPVLHRWFLARFPEPATWHRARLAFTRTTAVWSMVGHIVGLGDRHGENILLDATTGDCVHVDFAFLFDRVSALLFSQGLLSLLQGESDKQSTCIQRDLYFRMSPSLCCARTD